jgi:hypothetical protein
MPAPEDYLKVCGRTLQCLLCHGSRRCRMEDADAELAILSMLYCSRNCSLCCHRCTPLSYHDAVCRKWTLL